MTSSLRAAVAVILVTLSLFGCTSQGGGTRQTAKSEQPTPTPSASSSGAKGVASQRPVPVERNPPGDIPDNVAFVNYRNAAGRYSFVHPEGWASIERGDTVRFTDKLNGITVAATAAARPPTAATAKHDELPRLQSTEAAFELRGIMTARLPAGSGALIVYRRNSAPDPVTGRVLRDEVERYEIFSHGHLVILELFGPVGSDNVDAYRMISQSLRLA